MRQAFYYVIDEKFEAIASVLAYRLVNLWDRDVHIFIESKEPARQHNRVSHPRIFYHERKLEPLVPQGLPESSNWPVIVYARIFAPRFLQEYDRVIYLDADILPVRRDDRIWTLSLPHGLAAVHDCAATRRSPIAGKTRAQWLASIGVRSELYFNSGVLVIDVKPWLEIDFSGLLSSYVASHGESMNMFDQDFLNNVFQGKWVELSPAWNFQAVIFECDVDQIFPPIFIHFSKVEKPWMGRFDKNIHDIDYLSNSYMRLLSSDAGIDISSLASRRSSSQRLRYSLRKRLSASGFVTRRERNYRHKLALRREDFLWYLDQVRLRGGFADSAEWAIPAHFRSPLFDGKSLRLPASDGIKSRLAAGVSGESGGNS